MKDWRGSELGGGLADAAGWIRTRPNARSHVGLGLPRKDHWPAAWTAYRSDRCELCPSQRQRLSPKLPHNHNIVDLPFCRDTILSDHQYSLYRALNTLSDIPSWIAKRTVQSWMHNNRWIPDWEYGDFFFSSGHPLYCSQNGWMNGLPH